MPVMARVCPCVPQHDDGAVAEHVLVERYSSTLPSPLIQLANGSGFTPVPALVFFFLFFLFLDNFVFYFLSCVFVVFQIG